MNFYKQYIFRLLWNMKFATGRYRMSKTHFFSVLSNVQHATPFHWKMWSHQSFAIYWSNDVFMANANILAIPRKLVLNSWNFQMCSHFYWINWRAEMFIINNKIIQEMCHKFEAINPKPLTNWTWTKNGKSFFYQRINLLASSRLALDSSRTL